MGLRTFISHSTSDTAIVNKILARLETAGISCWIAPRDIPFGSTYAASIVQGIKSCTLMIFVFTKSSNNSEAVINEIENANSQKIPVIPFKISNEGYSDSLEYYLRSKQSINAFDKSLDKAIDELITYIAAPQAPPLPPPPPSPVAKKSKSKAGVIVGIIAVVLLVVYLLFVLNNNTHSGDRKGGDSSTVTSGTEKNEVLDIENGRIILYDDFSNNSNSWFVGQKDVTATVLENGVYSIENKENRSFYSISPVKVNIKATSDFIIEFVGRQVNGFGYSIGVDWRSDWDTDLKYSHVFLLCQNYKQYDYYNEDGYFKNGINYANSHPVFERAKSENINPYPAWNKITIIRQGPVLNFFINDHLINKCQYSGFDISFIGIGVAGQLKAEFKSLKIKAN